MGESFEILAPGTVAVPDVLKDLVFENAGEAIVLFALIFSGGTTSNSLSAMPEFKEGVTSLRSKGVLKVEGSTVTFNLEPLQEE